MLLAALWYSCGAGPETAPDGLVAGCYGYTSPTDTVSFRLEEVKGPVTGTLVYALGEKDRNAGTFFGEQRGDTLLGDYFFMSEGMESSRQVAFLLRDGSLVEGYGPMTDEGTTFADPRQIKFSAQMALERSDCPE